MSGDGAMAGWKVSGREVPMVVELRLRIVLESPPAGVDFGLQQGKGTDYRTIQTQRSQGDDLPFEGTVTAKDDRGDGPPNFLGPLTQGPPAGRFLYIDIGKSAGQADSVWERRIKVPLARHLVGDDRAGGGRPGARPRSEVAGDGEGWRAELCDRASPTGWRPHTSNTMNGASQPWWVADIDPRCHSGQKSTNSIVMKAGSRRKDLSGSASFAVTRAGDGTPGGPGRGLDVLPRTCP